jgi:hypothetical protein
MSFDNLTLWLITAMSLAAVFFLVWTFAALVRSSLSTPLTIGSGSGRRLLSAARYRGSD